MRFIDDGVAPFVRALSTVPGLQFNLGDVLQVIAVAKKDCGYLFSVDAGYQSFIDHNVAPVAKALSAVPGL